MSRPRTGGVKARRERRPREGAGGGAYIMGNRSSGGTADATSSGVSTPTGMYPHQEDSSDEGSSGDSGRYSRSQRTAVPPYTADVSNGASVFSGSNRSTGSSSKKFSLDDWSGVVDRVYNARPNKRVSDLTWLWTVLSTEYYPEKVLNSQDLLISALTSSVAKSTCMSEKTLACSCLGAVMLTIGTDEISVINYEMVAKSLQKAATDIRSGPIRGQASLLLGLLAYLGCSDDATPHEIDIERWMTDVSDNIDFHETSPSFAEPDAGLFNNATASAEISKGAALRSTLSQASGLLRGRALLATQWHRDLLADWRNEGGQQQSRNLFLFALKCIKRRTPALQEAAGLVIALLLEAHWGLALKNGEAEAAVVREESKDDRELLALLRDLSGSTQRFSNRRLGGAETGQRSFFRMVLRTAETGEGPSEQLGGTTPSGSRRSQRSLDSWSSYIRYVTFRDLLRGALSTHINSNPSVAASLGSGWEGGGAGAFGDYQSDGHATSPHPPTATNKYTVDMRAQRAAEEKYKGTRRSKQRKWKYIEQNYGGAADGSD